MSVITNFHPLGNACAGGHRRRKELILGQTSLCVTALKRVLFRHSYSPQRPRWAHVERSALASVSPPTSVLPNCLEMILMRSRADGGRSPIWSHPVPGCQCPQPNAKMRSLAGPAWAKILNELIYGQLTLRVGPPSEYIHDQHAAVDDLRSVASDGTDRLGLNRSKMSSSQFSHRAQQNLVQLSFADHIFRIVTRRFEPLHRRARPR